MNPVCLVIGAGAGIGGTAGQRFAREGYHAALCRRSDQQGLDRLARSVCPPMEARGSGTILVTSATAAVRGNAGQHRSVWTHELDLRSYSDSAWWNS